MLERVRMIAVSAEGASVKEGCPGNELPIADGTGLTTRTHTVSYAPAQQLLHIDNNARFHLGAF